MIVGEIYQLRKGLRVKQEPFGPNAVRFSIRSKTTITVVDVQYIGTGRRENEQKIRDFYKVAILVDNKIAWIPFIDEIKFRQKLRLVNHVES